MLWLYPVTPVSAPRQIARDRYNPSDHVVRYRSYCRELQTRHCFIPRDFHHMVFVLEMPESWSDKKRTSFDGMPHQSTPDRDNLEKAVLDAVMKDDACVWNGHTTKVWGARPMLIISDRVLPLLLPLHLEPLYGLLRRQPEGLIPMQPLSVDHTI